MTNFIIYSYPRTGSTYLCKALNSGDNIICHSEIFHKEYKAFNRSFLDKGVINKVKKSSIFINSDKKAIEKLYLLRNKKPDEFLKKVFKSQDNTDGIGFKIFAGQNDKVLETLLASDDVKKIFLYRENFIESLISEKIALKSGMWDSTYNKREKVEITITPEEIISYSSRIESYTKLIQNISSDFLSISYEEITTNFPIEKIEDYLGIKLRNISLQTDETKQNTFNLGEIITNYQELKSHFEGTRFFKYL